MVGVLSLQDVLETGGVFSSLLLTCVLEAFWGCLWYLLAYGSTVASCSALKSASDVVLPPRPQLTRRHGAMGNYKKNVTTEDLSEKRWFFSSLERRRSLCAATQKFQPSGTLRSLEDNVLIDQRLF